MLAKTGASPSPSLRASYLIPTPGRAALLVGAAALLGVAGGLLGWGPAVQPVSSQPQPAVVTGHGGTSGPSLTLSPEEMVLSQADVRAVSPGMESRPGTDGPGEGAAGIGSASEEDLRRYREWGYVGSHASQFLRPALGSDRAALIDVRDQVLVFSTGEGARDALAYELSRLPVAGREQLPLPAMGDATAAFRFSDGPFVRYLVLLRKGNGLGTLLATGLRDGAGEDTFVALARTLAGRMR